MHCRGRRMKRCGLSRGGRTILARNGRASLMLRRLALTRVASLLKRVASS